MTRYWLAMPAPDVPPAVLLRDETGPRVGRAWYASRAGWEIAGLGEAAVVRAEGPDRFEVVSAAVDRLFAELEPLESTPDGVAPRLVGGFSFADGWTPAPGSAWAGFATARLVLPEVAVLTGPAGAWLVAVAPRGLGRDDAAQHLRRRMGDCGERMQWLSRQALGCAGEPVVESADPAVYEASVADALEAIEGGVLSKVIVARDEVWRAEPAPDPASLTAALADRFPSCFLFSVQPAGGATFLGASPERLVSVAAGRVATDALAGTARRSDDPTQDQRLGAELLASDKERREHAACVGYLRATLADVVAELPPESPPTLLRLANVQHLHTPLGGRSRDGRGALELASLLHPTPAVCGVPSRAAAAWLDEHEALDRGWYAGAVGVLGPGGDGEFCVAIRSALVDGDTTTLFAGAGIVAGSVPARERAEVDVKLNGMREVLFHAGA